MNYEVAAPIVSGTAEASADAQRDATAIFIAHGMGQQVPFETIDVMARGICEQSHGHVDRISARTIRVDCERLQRLELEFDDGRPPIHIYEGYWAPMTEGVIGIWEVVRFLISAAVNGATSRLRLRRFLFGKVRHFKVALFDVVNLILAVLVVLSIVLVGTTIIVIGTARLAFKDDAWIMAPLGDLTVIFELLLIVLLACAAAASIGLLARRLRRAIAVPAAFAGAAFIAAAVAIVFAFLVNEKPPFPSVTKDVCAIPPWVMWSHNWITANAGMVAQDLQRAMVFGLFGVALMLFVFALQRNGIRWSRALVALLIVLVAVKVLFARDCRNLFALTTWLVLLGVAMFVRWFVIQYVGDVTIYVSSHQLDRFFAVRQEIKNSVWKAARAVYAYSGQHGEPVYRRVIMAGHSLGSVVVYDALNRLLNDDKLAGAKPDCCDDAPTTDLDVRSRTRLLLTFGSPLDKTAFVFATHASETGSERETLAAAVQPLILDQRGFPWLNVYSPQDVISGSLEFYDTPPGDPSNENRVTNMVDPFATTPLKAHVEYWQGTLIYRACLEMHAPLPEPNRARA